MLNMFSTEPTVETNHRVFASSVEPDYLAHFSRFIWICTGYVIVIQAFKKCLLKTMKSFSMVAQINVHLQT